MKFEQLKAEHVVGMGPLADIHQGYELTAELAVALEDCGGHAAIDDDGKVVAVAGILPRWHGVGMGWAWLSKDWRKHARRITAQVITVLEQSDCHRIEAGVQCGFKAGHRWMKRLGFEVETPCAKGWGPDGKDYTIYVRCKNG